MMTEFVRKVIEENIDAIEHNEWEEFFYEWCAYDAHPEDEPEYWNELVDVFKDLDIFVDYNCTKSAVTSYVSNFIEDEKQNDPSGFIAKSFLISKAYQMNIDEAEAKNIVEHVAKELGLTEFNYYSTEGYTW